MNKKIIIIGASGLGKEVLWLAQRCGREVLGFLDDTEAKQGSVINSFPVLGKINNWPNYSDCEFIIAVGSPQGRKKILELMQTLGNPSFCTLIDPSAIIGDSVAIGDGCIICAGVICTVNINIFDHVIINLNSTVGHDTIINELSTIAPNVSISGNITIEPCVEVGTGASVREKITLGSESLIGMGSVVTKTISKSMVVVGNPAKPLSR